MTVMIIWNIGEIGNRLEKSEIAKSIEEMAEEFKRIVFALSLKTKTWRLLRKKYETKQKQTNYIIKWKIKQNLMKI